MKKHVQNIFRRSWGYPQASGLGLSLGSPKQCLGEPQGRPQAPKEGQRRIDWILHRGDLTARSAKVCTYGRDGLWPSDHFPVLAVFSLAGAEES